MGRYRMKAVSRLTGVRPELLRMWEKRYQLFKPQRAGNRYREFDDDDVRLLLYIRQQIDQGRSIGELAAEGREALLRQLPTANGEASPQPSVYACLIDELLDAVQRLDKSRLETRLAESTAHHAFAPLLHHVLVPLMHRVGELWATHRLSVASERLATMLIKQRLLTLLQLTTPGPQAPLLVCASPPGEFHELGLLTVAYTLQQDGWQVCYFGPDFPLTALHQSCEALQPALVALSFTYVSDADRCRETLHALDTTLGAAYPTLVGGQAIGDSLPRPRHLSLLATPQDALCAARALPTRRRPTENPPFALGKLAVPH